MPDESKRGVLRQVRNPLVFFALALLVIEGIIGAVVAASGMTGGYKFASVCLMAFLFLVVVVAVIIITIRWPENLYESIAEQRETIQQITEFINSPGFRDSIEDAIEARVKSDSLMRREPEGGCDARQS